jgi:phospholipase D1/2
MLCDNENVWKRKKAKNVSFLVDASTYFDALAETLQKAEKTIFILAWDVNSQVELRKDSAPGKNIKLGSLIHQLVSEKPNLHVYILCWNFPLAFSPNRETPLSLVSGWETHERITIVYDDFHPVGACHHQKVVVIDDAIAFSGGIDISQGRWDTSEHLAADPRRTDSAGTSYSPFHDVQSMVDGEVAAALGDLFRERWNRATDHSIPKIDIPVLGFPEKIPIDLNDIDVGISRTYPHFGGYELQNEIEKITLASLKQAQNLIYIENQFLTAKKIVAQLRSILVKKEGPDVIIVLPLRAASIIEEIATNALQNRLIKKLKAVDYYQRLGVFYPAIPGEPNGVLVHSKVTIIDDDFVKIGSANFNNRSMGVDTECDLSFEASNHSHRKSISSLREKLVCEHLGLSREELHSAISEQGSLLKAIYSRFDKLRTLRPQKLHTPFFLRWLVLGVKAYDPSAPLAREQLVSDFLKTERRRTSRLSLLGVFSAFFVILCLSAVWYWVPLEEFRYFVSIKLGDLKTSSALVLGCSLVLMPPTLLVLGTYTFLGPKLGFLVGWIFIVIIAFVQYCIGILLPHRIIKKLALWGTFTLGQQLVRLRALPDFILRLLPAAPMPVLSLISGTVRMPLVGFFFITVFGALPLLISLGAVELFFEILSDIAGAKATSLFLFICAIIFLILVLLHPKGRNVLKRGYK